MAENKKIAVITSGGDAPGMNAAVRSVVRTAIDLGAEVYGVKRGYAGLIEGDLTLLKERDVSGTIQLGGTFLGTARSEEFKKADNQKQCVENLKTQGINGIIVIGGNGSQAGAHALNELGLDVMGVASTVDNDLFGTDISIGADTALNTIVESIDKIKTTARSHQRAFLIEVMGRRYGYLALMAGIAGGAELVVTPEFEIEPADVAKGLLKAYEDGKQFAIVLVTDGAKNNAEKIAAYFKKHQKEIGYELRITILGHVQRGGSPSVFDRLLATRLGAEATKALIEGESGKLAGWCKGEICLTPLKEIVGKSKELDMGMWELGKILAK